MRHLTCRNNCQGALSAMLVQQNKSRRLKRWISHMIRSRLNREQAWKRLVIESASSCSIQFRCTSVKYESFKLIARSTGLGNMNPTHLIARFCDPWSRWDKERGILNGKMLRRAGLTEMAQGRATRGSGKNRLARASASRLLCIPVEQTNPLMKPHTYTTRWLDSEELQNTSLKGRRCLIFSQPARWIKAARSVWGAPP
jgi:hypothetical protein